jgi:hypothetical protein
MILARSKLPLEIALRKIPREHLELVSDTSEIIPLAQCQLQPDRSLLERRGDRAFFELNLGDVDDERA